MDLNILLRGQSNSLLFADFGGAGEMERQLEQKLGGGVDVHLLYRWGDEGGNNTINSGSAFMAWDTDGKQAGFMRYLNGLPEDLQDNPTITLWMHNEDEMKNNPATWDWVSEVRTDAAMVRDALGQGASTTPYLFTWVPYNYGQGTANVQAGMRELAADGSFNAELALNAMDGIAMDGDGYPHSSHMGHGDASVVAGRLADALAPMAGELANGGGGGAPPHTPTPPPPVELTAGTGPDSLVLKVSQDAYQGSAKYTVSVDGEQIGGEFTASAWRSAGQSDTLTLKGDWAAGAHRVEVKFLNDAWGGTAATDRNLHVEGATYNGQAVAGAAKALMAAGAADFAFTETATNPSPPTDPVPMIPPPLSGGTGPDALVLKVSQDAYQGPAEFTVSVDGEQVGGTFTASAGHGSGVSGTVTLNGDWGPGEHAVEVKFLNDHWDGTAATDRNLHVDGATYNGRAVAGAALAFESDWKPGGFSFTEAAAPTPAPPVKEGTDRADLFDVAAAGGVFAGKGGRDMFVFEAGDGQVTITDFAPGTDKLVFVGFDDEDVSSAKATEDGASGLLVTYGDSGSVFLAGVSALADRDLAFG